jgi:hypothetical protein
VAPAGDYLYVTDEFHDLTVIDMMTPASYNIVKSIDMPGEVFGIVSDGSYIYVGDSEGLFILDISDSENPWTANTIDVPTRYSMIIKEGYLFAQACPQPGQEGLYIFDISSAEDAYLLTGIESDYMRQMTDLELVDNLAYILDAYDGLRIVRLY